EARHECLALAIDDVGVWRCDRSVRYVTNSLSLYQHVHTFLHLRQRTIEQATVFEQHVAHVLHLSRATSQASLLTAPRAISGLAGPARGQRWWVSNWIFVLRAEQEDSCFNSSRCALTSSKSAMSKPSVNQP